MPPILKSTIYPKVPLKSTFKVYLCIYSAKDTSCAPVARSLQRPNRKEGTSPGANRKSFRANHPLLLLFPLPGDALDGQLVDSRPRDCCRVEIRVLSRMIVVHQLLECVHLLLALKNRNMPLSDHALIGKGAVALVLKVLQSVIAVHLKGSAVVIFYKLELVPLRGTVEEELDLPVLTGHAKIQRENVWKTVLVVQGNPADVTEL